ncbi:MAG: hypothetical protein LBL93_03795 [Ruminococcus sp.]|jgi:hypothetical protein|nr:hypothetical protein [Ruminococcus sp.]
MKYKNRPIVRKGNEIYYGDPTGEYVVRIMLDDITEISNVKVSKKARAIFMSTDKKLSPIEAIKNNRLCKSLFEALDYGDAWLRLGV